MSQLKDWIGKNTVRITALATAVIALGLGFGWWDWTSEQIGLVMGAIAAVLAFFVSSTVTANVRLGDGSLFANPLKGNPQAPVQGD